MRAVLVVVVLAVLAGCGGGDGPARIVLRADGATPSQLRDAAAIVQRRLRALRVDATATVRDRDVLVEAAPDVRVPPEAWAPGRAAFYDLEAAAGESPLPSRRGTVVCAAPSEACPGVFGAVRKSYRYRFSGRPALGAGAIGRARTVFDAQTGRPAVLVVPKGSARRPFRELTRRLAAQGAARGEPQHLAIVVDGRLLAWPQIDYRMYPDGVDVAQGLQIPASSRHEARVLAAQLGAGALPVRLRVVGR